VTGMEGSHGGPNFSCRSGLINSRHMFISEDSCCEASEANLLIFRQQERFRESSDTSHHEVVMMRVWSEAVPYLGVYFRDAQVLGVGRCLILV
jgi:hypothetical protein